MGLRTWATTTLAFLAATVSTVDINVKSKGGNKTSIIPYGLMHEDINNAGDGGIYAELIRNRAFQGSNLYPVSLSGWSPVNGAGLSIKHLTVPLSKALTASMNVAVDSMGSKAVGFSNDGFWGMDVQRQRYTGSFYVRGSYKGAFTASLQSAITDESYGSVTVESNAKKNEWVRHKFTLVPKKDAPSSNNTFAITFDPAGVSGGSLDFNLISLFPPTYKGRENGLRVDLAEAFAALDPKFLRFPGGNALEGPDLANPWRWNETIGPLKDRPGRPGVWNYQTSDGLGLVEYLHWCDDMNLEPITVLAIHSGLALDGAYIKESDLGPWVEDALNEIEFVRGATSTPYGNLRASLGYPKPWNLKYVEVGNEDWLAGRPAGFDSYLTYRFEAFTTAIKKKYPDIQVIASPSVFDGMTIPAPAAGDYHPYRQPDNFFNEFHLLDHLSKDNLTLVGEFASVHPNGGIDWAGNLHPFPWWIGGVGEAIFMISTERNGDRILGTTYAPMLRNMNRWQWSACMIEFEADIKKTTLSTSYHVFKLISTHTITHTLPTTPTSNSSSLFFVAGMDEDSGGLVWKGANYNTTNHEATPVSVKFEGLRKDATAELTLLTSSAGPFGFNDPSKGNNVVVTTTKTLSAGKNGAFEFSMPELSVAVLDTDVSGHGRKERRSQRRYPPALDRKAMGTKK
ncbi:glycoside hydrolase family 51 protein [Amniculicola lignicola CBS 123094]|uniref:non-reducing end alpha-L-arabinofuranosidase n=1 Tax=Amniculicola lignicola CBS 123094 TaxID=1392246 RepID=A0A6A5WQY2_9PLEO|nr:glycoside hydrolase family 51 protein [Amniculicola lignicola CBS 123094]